MELLDEDGKFALGAHNRTVDDLLANGYETDAYRYIREGWEIFRKGAGFFVAFTVITGAIGYLFSEVRFGSLLSILVMPCLTAGFLIAAKRISHLQPLEFGHFFDGFKLWQKIIPYALVSQIFMVIGLVFLVLPGIYLAVSYLFVAPMILFYREDLPLIDHLEASRKVVTKNWWNFLGFVGLLILVNLAGAICFGIGLLASIPVSACAVYAAYEDVFGVGSEDNIPQ